MYIGVYIHVYNCALKAYQINKEMAVHFSILAWRIPRKEEPGRLWSTGLHRVRHDLSDLTCILIARIHQTVSSAWRRVALGWFGL